jgi:hypothetical protein
MAPAIPRGLKPLRVGSVIEQRQDGRTFLLVQETPDRTSVIESWDDALDVANRLLGRLKRTLEDMNAGMTKSNKRLTVGLRETGAKIAANQRLLDKIVKGDS